MMRTIRYLGQFKKDAKLLIKRGYAMNKLQTVVEKLAHEEVLEPRYRDHPLHGKYEGTRDCHVSPDWILIYAVVGTELRLIRTGTHSDLYGK